MGLWQLFALRSLLAFPVLLGASLLFVRPRRLAPKSVKWIAIRSLLLTLMWITYYVALPLIPLGVAAAAYYTLPLFIVIFAALIGRESVGQSQWGGVALGFIGVLLILRPLGEAFVWAALLPIVSAILYALAMILTRTRCRHEHPATLALGLNATFIVVGLAGLLWGWAFKNEAIGLLSPQWISMTQEDWGTTAILAILILAASVGTALAYQVAPASTIGTFDFAYVGFALIWGVIFFQEQPDGWSLLGIALIVFAGVLAVRRSGE